MSHSRKVTCEMSFQIFSCAQGAVNHNMAVRDEQKEPVQAQAEIEVDVAKENAKAWDKMVTKNKKTNQESAPTHPMATCETPVHRFLSLRR